MGGERRRGAHEGGVYIYICIDIIMTDLHDVWPTPPQHYNAIILQFKNKKEKL